MVKNVILYIFVLVIESFHLYDFLFISGFLLKYTHSI